jgi:hypothetical protein
MRLRAVGLGARRDSLEGGREQVDLETLSQLQQARLAPGRTSRSEHDGDRDGDRRREIADERGISVTIRV